MCAVSLTGSIKRACSLASHHTCEAPGRALLAARWSSGPHRSRLQAQRQRRGAGGPLCSIPKAGGSALCLSLQPPRRRLQEQLNHRSSATPARRRPRRQDAEAQPAAGRQLLLAPILLVRARLGCDNPAVAGRVPDAAAGAFGGRGGGWSGRGSAFCGALGTWLLVARGATWSLVSGEGNRARERELVVGLPALYLAVSPQNSLGPSRTGSG